MWGICLDISVPEIFQHAVEFKTDSENAIILNPVKYIKIPVNKIELTANKPDFIYGETISVINMDISGKIYKIIWHYKRKEFCYYIEVNGRKKIRKIFQWRFKTDLIFKFLII